MLLTIPELLRWMMMFHGYFRGYSKRSRFGCVVQRVLIWTLTNGIRCSTFRTFSRGMDCLAPLMVPAPSVAFLLGYSTLNNALLTVTTGQSCMRLSSALVKPLILKAIRNSVLHRISKMITLCSIPQVTPGIIDRNWTR